MFFYFFEEYKEKIYKGSRRKFKWYELLMLTITIAVTLLFLLAVALNWGTIAKASLFAMLLIAVIGAWIYTNRDIKKNMERLLRGHKERHIEPLCQQIKNYNLYTDSGVNWLIDCCTEKREKSQDYTLISAIKRFFMGVIYPLITLALGLILKDSASDDVIQFIAMMIVIFIVGGGSILCFQPVIQFILFPDKNIVDYLEEDLKYIRTQMKTEQI